MSTYMSRDETAEEIAERQKHYQIRHDLGEHRSAELPPHNPDATCPKCGADAARIMVVYHAVALEAFVGPMRLTLNREPCAGKYLNQHLCRTCGRCDYSWQERCVTTDSPDQD